MQYKAGFRRDSWPTWHCEVQNFCPMNQPFLSSWFFIGCDFISLIITNRTSPDPRPHATRLCNTSESDSCVNQWFVSNPCGDKCQKNPPYLTSVNCGRTVSLSTPTKHLRAFIKYGPEEGSWRREDAWILRCYREQKILQEVKENKYSKAKQYPWSWKVKTLNSGHRTVNDKAQQNTNQIKESQLKQVMRPIDTYVSLISFIWV